MSLSVILVLDDEETVREFISDFLRDKISCDVHSFGDGHEVVQFLSKNYADIIVLDIKMPKKSGISVIKEVKEFHPEVDILVVSAWISSDVSNEALCAGATDYMVKPLDLKVLELKITDILKKRKS